MTAASSSRLQGRSASWELAVGKAARDFCVWGAMESPRTECGERPVGFRKKSKLEESWLFLTDFSAYPVKNNYVSGSIFPISSI